MLRRTAFPAAVAATILCLVAGCGSSSSGGSNESSAPPRAELNHAFHALAASQQLVTTIGLHTTGAEIMRIGAMGGGSAGITTTQADAIAGAHITAESIAPKGKTVGSLSHSPTGAATSLTAGSGATAYVSLRTVNGTLYLQVDLKDLLKLAGDSSEYRTLRVRTATLPSFVQAFVDGKWVSLSLATLSSLEQFVAGASGGKVPSSAQATLLTHKLLSAISNDVTVARTSTGSTDHLTITGNLKTIAGDVLNAVSSVAPSISSSTDTSSVPDKNVTVNAAVTDGAISSLSIDLGQFSTKGPFSLPVVATFSRTAPPISAPTGATQVNVQELASLLAAFGGSA